MYTMKLAEIENSIVLSINDIIWKSELQHQMYKLTHHLSENLSSGTPNVLKFLKDTDVHNITI